MEVRKRILSVILALSMVLSTGAVPALTVYAGEDNAYESEDFQTADTDISAEELVYEAEGSTEEVSELPAEETPDPVVEYTAEPVVEDITDPVAEYTADPVDGDIADTASDDATVPVTDDTGDQTVEDIDDPAADDTVPDMTDEEAEDSELLIAEYDEDPDPEATLFEAEGISIWYEDLRDNDRTFIYSDEMNFMQPINTSELSDGFNLFSQLGYLDDDNEFNEIVRPNTIFDEDRGKWCVSISGSDFEYICETQGVTSLVLKTTALADGSDDIIAEYSVWVDLYLPYYDFQLPVSDWDGLPGWSLDFGEYFNCYVANTNHLYGDNVPAQIVNVILTRDEGITYEAIGDPFLDENGWHIQTNGMGHATLTLQYYIEENSINVQERTININVGGEVWNLWQRESTGMDRLVPGESFDLISGISREYMDPEDGFIKNDENIQIYYPGMSDPQFDGSVTYIEYEWQWLKEDGNEDTDNSHEYYFYSVVNNLGGRDTCMSVTANDVLLDQEVTYIVRLNVYQVLGLDGNGGCIRSEVKAWWDNDIHIQTGYSTIDPAYLEIDQMMPGDEITLVPVLNNHYLDEDGNVVVTPVENVRWRFDYDENAVQISDSAPFTIRKLSNYNTDIRLHAEVANENGDYEEWTYRNYYIDTPFNSIWFDDMMDNRIFSDEQKTIYMHVSDEIAERLADGSYFVEVKAGTRNDNNDDWVTVLEPGTDYTASYNDGTEAIALNIAGIIDKIGDDQFVNIQAWVKYNAGGEYEYEVAWTDTWVNVRKATQFYYEQEDRIMLPGWDGRINNSIGVSVRNSAYPDGMDFNCPVTAVEITEQKNWSGEDADNIVSLRYEINENDQTDYWWYYRAEDYGWADFKVSYLDLNEEPQSYTFRISVKKDVYSVDIWTEGNIDFVLPGGTIDVYANANHQTDYEDVFEDLVFDWNITEGSDWGTLEVLDPLEDGTQHAQVHFNEVDPDDYGWHHMNLTVDLYDNLYQDPAATTGPAASANRTLISAQDYTDLLPREINSGMEIGTSITVNPEVRRYHTAYQNEDNPEGYIFADHEVHYRWYYDSNAVQIYDSEGNPVGNNDAADNYNDSAASWGVSPAFTIVRSGDWDTTIALDADWVDENGSDRHEHREYQLNRRNYDIWFEYAGFNWQLYSGEADDVILNCSPEVTEALENGCTLVFEAGEWEWTDSNGNGYWKTTLPLNGGGCQLNGMTVSLDGSALLYNYNCNNIRIIARLMNGETEVRSTDCWVGIREAIEDYNMEQSRRMLPGFSGSVNAVNDVYVENSEYQGGRNTQYEVTGVNIIEQKTWDGQDTNGVIEMFYDYNESNPDDHWWYFKALDYGYAVLEVSYTDIHGMPKSYEFRLDVVSDIYDVHLWAADELTNTLTGGSIDVYAIVYHSSDHPNGNENYGFNWMITEGGQYAYVTELEPLEDGTQHVRVTFDQADPDDYSRHEIRLSVDVSNGTGPQGEPNYVTNGNIILGACQDYTEIIPGYIDHNMVVGQRIKVNPEVRRYNTAYRSEDNPEGYILADESNEVHFMWFYDSNAVTIFDKDGNVVGNNDENNIYNDSSASWGKDTEFTICRTEGWGTIIALDADWVDENGEHRHEHREYHLNPYNEMYNLEGLRGGRNNETWVFEDETDYTLMVNVDSLEDIDYIIDWKVGWMDEYGEFHDDDILDTGYTINGNTITFSGPELKAALESQTDDWRRSGVQIGAMIRANVGGESDPVYKDIIRVQEVWISVRNNIVNYNFPIRDIFDIPGRGFGFSKQFNCYVENKDYPQGRTFDVLITDAELIPDMGSEESIILNEWMDGNGWSVGINGYGHAVLRLTYTKYDSDTDTETVDFNVYGNRDNWTAEVYPATGTNNILPGGEMDLYAVVYHEGFDDNNSYYCDENPEGYEVVWEPMNGGNGTSWSDSFEAIDQESADPADPYRVTIKAKEDAQPGTTSYIGVSLISPDEIMPDGQNRMVVTSAPIQIFVSDMYGVIEPLELTDNYNLLPGQSIENVSPNLRKYYIDSETGEAGTELVDDENVRFRWIYDSKKVVITDVDNNVLSGDSNAGEGSGESASEAGEGESDDGTGDGETAGMRGTDSGDTELVVYGNKPYKITKLTNENTNVELVAEEKGSDGVFREQTRRSWHLNSVNFDFSIDNVRGMGNTWVYSDETDYTLTLNVAGLENMDYRIDWKVGWTDETGEFQDDSLLDTGYTVKGNTITFSGPEFLAALEAQPDMNRRNGANIGAVISINGGDEADPDYREIGHIRLIWIYVQRSMVNYRFPIGDTNMLVNNAVGFNKQFTCYVQNADYPQGQNITVMITNAELIPDMGQQNSFLMSQWPDGSGWTINTTGLGHAVLRLTYTRYDSDTETDTIDFNIWASQDIWNAYVSPVNNINSVLPGGEMDVYTVVTHEGYDENQKYYYVENPEGIDVEWTPMMGDDGTPWSDSFEAINQESAEPADQFSVTIKAKDDAQPGAKSYLGVNVYPLDENGERQLTPDGQNEVIIASSSIPVNVVNSFYMVEPLALIDDYNLLPGESVTNVTPSLIRYYIDRETGEPSEEVLENARFRWIYDSKDVMITDADGNELSGESGGGQGSGESAGEQGSGESAGGTGDGESADGTGDGETAVITDTDGEDEEKVVYGNKPYTITKLTNNNANIQLVAEAQTPDGSYREQIRRGWTLNRVDYSIPFIGLRYPDQGWTIVYSDETDYTLMVDTSELGDLDYTIDWKVGYMAGMGDVTDELDAGFTENEDGSITLDGSVLKDHVREGSDGVNVLAIISYNGKQLVSNATWVGIRDPYEYYDLPEEELRFMPRGMGYVISKDFAYEIRNAEYPNGNSGMLEITSADFYLDPANENPNAISFTWEPKSNGWRITADEVGHATITLTYNDFNGQTLTRTIEVWIVSEFWNVGVYTDTYTDCILPGDSMNLIAYADCWRYDEETKTRIYDPNARAEIVWEPIPLMIPWDTLFTTEDVEGHPEMKHITASPDYYNIPGVMIVTAYPLDENGNRIPDGEGGYVIGGSDSIQINITREYLNFEPIDLEDYDLEIGESITVDPKMYRYYVDPENGKAREEVTDTMWHWTWDKDVFEIIDVHNMRLNDLDDEPAGGVYGHAPFTITRISGSEGSVELHADIPAGDGSEYIVNYTSRWWGFDGLTASGPVITKQPEDATAAIGENAYFSIEAEGDGLTYQWQFRKNSSISWGNTSMAGAKTDTITVPVTAARNGYQYRCIITDSRGNTVESEPATLTVGTELMIIGQPEDAAAAAGENAYFSVAAEGDGLTYQWQFRKNSNISWANTSMEGANTDRLTVPATTARNGYQYRCIVTDNRGNSVTSETATLTVGAALRITQQPEDATAAAGENAYFSVAAEGDGLTYKWQFRKNSSVSWGSTSMAGAATDTITVPVTAARNGYQYRCVVTDSRGNSVTSEAAVLTVRKALEITEQPEDVAAAAGETAYFSIAAEGEGLTYQWQFRKNSSISWANTSMEGAKTDTITVPVTAARDGYQYRCIVTDDRGDSVTSEAATLTIRAALKITQQPEDVIAAEGDTAYFSIAAEGDGLTYQWQYRTSGGSWKNTSMAGAKTDTITVPVLITRNGYQYRCKVTDSMGNSLTSETAELIVRKELVITGQPEDVKAAAGDTVYFSITAEGEGELTYQWQFRKNSNISWANTSMAGAKTDTLTVPVTTARNGYQYRCIVTDESGNSVTSETAVLSLKKGLAITEQPEDVTAADGDTVYFSITAEGEGLTYQWQFRKNSNISWANTSMAGAKTDILTVPVTTARNGYQYRCIVTDENGDSITSETAVLTVGAVLRITEQPENVTAAAGDTVYFSVTAEGEGLTYQWQFRKNSNISWANTSMAGATTDALTVPVTTARNGYQYRCIVTDSSGNTVTSDTAKLIVE